MADTERVPFKIKAGFGAGIAFFHYGSRDSINSHHMCIFRPHFERYVRIYVVFVPFTFLSQSPSI